VTPYGGKADLMAVKDKSAIHIEVRSTSSGEINGEVLDSEKAELASGEDYYLAKVVNIPNAPQIYLLKFPKRYEGIRFEMKIPKSVFEQYSEKIDAKKFL